jgi:hypothetical protein
MQTAPATSEAAIWTRVIQPEVNGFSPEVARSIVSLDFCPEDRERMQKLAAKAQEGTLSPDEETEIDTFEKVGHVLSLMKAKAKVSLKKKP